MKRASNKIAGRDCICNLYAFVVIFYPILNVYKVFLPLGDIVAIIAVPIFLLFRLPKRKNIIKYDKSYYVFIIYCFLSMPYSAALSQSINIADIFTKTFHLVLYMLYGLVFPKRYLIKEKLISLLIKIAAICSVIAILEQLMYVVSGKQLYLLLPGVTLNYAIEDYTTYIYRFTLGASSQGYRASSLFLEPAHFSEFVLVALIVQLTKSKEKWLDYMLIAVYILSVLCSYSTGGMISIAVCISYYLIFQRTVKKAHFESFFKMIMVYIIILGGIFLITNETRLVTSILSRINEIGSTVYDTSGNRRILRGWFVWREMPASCKIIGTGIGGLLQSITDLNIQVLTDTTYSDEMSTVFYVLCSCGVCGAFLYFRAIIINIIRGGSVQKLMSIIYLISCIYNNILFHAISVIYLLLMFVPDLYESKAENKINIAERIL